MASRVSPLVLLPPAIFAGLAVVFWLGLGGDKQLPSTLIGRAAPALPVGALGDLPQIEPGMLTDGEVKLVNFWASWCAPCRVEHPNLSGLAAEGVPIYGVNYKDKPGAATGFLAELGNPYRATGTDDNGRIGLEWGVYGVPETFVVDGEGRILLRFAGPVTQRVIEADLRPLLSKPD